MTIASGRKHIVRRMVEAVGHRVIQLLRIGYGVLELGKHGVVEAQHRGFRRLRHHGLRKDDAGLPHGRQQRLDVRTRLDNQHDRQGIAAQIEVVDRLFHAVIVNVEILLGEVEDHLAHTVPYGHRRRHFFGAHADGALLLLRGGHLPRRRARLDLDRPRWRSLASRRWHE